MKQIFGFGLMITTLMSWQQLFGQLYGKARADSLLQELPKQNNDTDKLSILQDLSAGYVHRDPDKGIAYSFKGLKLAKKLDDTANIAWANNNLGNNYESKADYDSALLYFHEALRLHEQSDNQYGVAAVNCNIGIVYTKQSNYPKGLEYFFKALKTDEENGFEDFAVNVSANIGIVYSNLGEHTKALEYDLKALAAAEKIDNKIAIAGITCNVGGEYSNLNDNEKALDYYFKALKLDEAGGYKQYSSIVTAAIGSVYFTQKNYTLAIEYFKKSEKTANETGDKSSVASSLISIGKTYTKILTDTAVNEIGVKGSGESGLHAYQPDGSIPMGKTALLRSATDHLQRGLNMALAINALDLMQQGYEGLSEIYRLKGEYKLALQASDNMHAIKDSMFSKENREQILKLDMKNEYDRKRLADSLKAVEKEHLGVVRLQKQKTYTYFGFAGILLLAGFSFFIVRERGKSEVARKQSDDLLLNILPEQVAAELKATGTTTARQYNNVTVLFTDFVNFTEAAESMNAQSLIDELHSCFKAFDDITARYGIEKIKTIGDAYLAVAGLPRADQSHAEHVTSAALEIMKFMEDRYAMLGGRTFEIRIGIHSGSVVAGIVGVKKFAYDIWGDTVNTAARMEQNCEPGKINISETTYELVKNKFDFEYRGELEAKGKGMMKMYYLSSRDAVV